MYAVIRAYTGNSDLADRLAEHEEDIRQQRPTSPLATCS